MCSACENELQQMEIFYAQEEKKQYSTRKFQLELEMENNQQ
jgi:hypothetical protein